MTDGADIPGPESPLRERLAALEQRMRAGEARLRSLEACVDEHAGRVVALETGHKTLAGAVSEVRAELRLLRADADAIKGELIAIAAGQKNAADRLAKVERRLAGWGTVALVLVEWGPAGAKALKAWAFGG